MKGADRLEPIGGGAKGLYSWVITDFRQAIPIWVFSIVQGLPGAWDHRTVQKLSAALQFDIAQKFAPVQISSGALEAYTSA